MSSTIPSFSWIGGTLGVVHGGMTVTQVEMLHERVGGIEEKVDKLVQEVHKGHISVERFAVCVETMNQRYQEMGQRQEESRVILESLSDDQKFWRRIRTIGLGIAGFIAAYAIAWSDFIKNLFK